MSRLNIFLILPFILSACTEKVLTGPELLDKTIAFHDPNGEWSSLEATFVLQQIRANGRTSEMTMSVRNSDSYFEIIDQPDGHEIVKSVEGETPKVTFNGEEEFNEGFKVKYGLQDERILRTRNYYVYLYGLPMKLTDPGTNIRPEVKKAQFNGKEYLELGITYNEGIGNDDWYFYIDPETYAMEGYKFYHQNGKGEFITLEGLETIGGLKIPKDRKWYFTHDSTFLGSDVVASIKWN